jgi:hypothetical protein
MCRSMPAGGSTPRPPGVVGADATRLRTPDQKATDRYLVVLQDPNRNELSRT